MNRSVLHKKLDAPFRLRDEHIARFRRDGFVKLKDVLSVEVLDFCGEQISKRVAELSTEHRPLQDRDTYGKAFLQVTNVWTRCEIVKELVFSRRLAEVAARLVGVAGVRLYHDQALYKEGGGGITPWHRDQFYWPLATEKTCTVWIPLQETSLGMGPMAFAVGSQHAELGRELEIGDESHRCIDQYVSDHGCEVVQQPFELGEVSYHSGRTFHRSGANTTDEMRRAMTIIYMDRDMIMARPSNRFQEADREAWLAGTQPGEAINSPLTPVLWETQLR